MASEIEAKLKVGSHEEIIERLKTLGAEFVAEQLQTDYYFDNAGRSMARADECLRLRKQFVGGKAKVFLTYKGAREENRFKKRREIEIEVSNANAARELLSAMGYEKALIVEKTRRLWKLGDCEVALDELDLLGSFVEIEGADEKQIDEVQKSLGLAELEHIMESYACLIDEKLHGPLRN